MPLHWYRRQRVVVLKPKSSVLEAARAMDKNRIGAIVVQDRGSVVGIVTDRDLTVRALAKGLDPEATPLAEVMTPSPSVLTPAANPEDAIELMQLRNVRRIPLVEDGRVVGMVTLDDLLLDEAAPLEELAAVVEGQIGEGGPAPSPRLPARRRSLARAEATLGRLVNAVRAETGLEDRTKARKALEIVLGLLVRRVTPQEARDLIAQLPALLQPALRSLPPGPDKSIIPETFVEELSEKLELEADEAERLVGPILGVVASVISPGEVEDLRQQLPKEMRHLLQAPDPFDRA